MARRPKATADETNVREGFENFTLRLPVGQSERMTRFTTRHRLSVGELFTFGLNVANVKPDGSDRRMIDYARLNNELSNGEGGVIAHSGRFTLTEANRIRTFRTLHNLSMPYLLVYLMNEIDIGPAGESRLWIDFETMTIIQRGTDAEVRRLRNG